MRSGLSLAGAPTWAPNVFQGVVLIAAMAIARSGAIMSEGVVVAEVFTKWAALSRRVPRSTGTARCSSSSSAVARVSAIDASGARSTFAETGGAPNGSAFGPDGDL